MINDILIIADLGTRLSGGVVLRAAGNKHPSSWSDYLQNFDKPSHHQAIS
jgi:hypothetical protein